VSVQICGEEVGANNPDYNSNFPSISARPIRDTKTHLLLPSDYRESRKK